MLSVNKELCNGCGVCQKLCPQEAINIQDGIANIYQDICTQCNLCLKKCPKGAISEQTNTNKNFKEKGDTQMFYRQHRNCLLNNQPRMGFSELSSNYPYIGRGRGGLPRCQQPGLQRIPVNPGAIPQDENIGQLKAEAERLSREISRINERIQSIENQ